MADISKLNKTQRGKLREMFSGRVARAVYVDDVTDQVTVTFDHVIHFFYLGPRGGVTHHTISSTSHYD